MGTVGPTARYLIQECGFSAERLREDITLLAYSLDARVKPRALFARKLELPMPSLRNLTIVDDFTYCQAIGCAPDKYNDFTRELRREAADAARSKRPHSAPAST